MKRTLLSSVAAAAFLLAGCNITMDPATLAAIQAVTVAECGFLPTEVQIAELFPNAAPAAAAAGVIGGIICQAVVAQIKPADAHAAVATLAPTSITVTLPDGRTATITGTFVPKMMFKYDSLSRKMSHRKN